MILLHLPFPLMRASTLAPFSLPCCNHDSSEAFLQGGKRKGWQHYVAIHMHCFPYLSTPTTVRGSSLPQILLPEPGGIGQGAIDDPLARHAGRVSGSPGDLPPCP